jgi:hypothetical protein
MRQAAGVKAGHSWFYDWYLGSSLWRARRWLWYHGSDRHCESCGARLRLHKRSRGRADSLVMTVHHVTYVRLGRERRGDVELLCWPCHQHDQAHFDPRGVR